MDTEFFVDWYIDDDYNSDILFNSISRIVEVDGREVDHIDLRDAISSEEKEYNGTVIVKDEYELSEGETLTIYVQAEDYLGYIHKLNVMEFTVSNGEMHQSTDTPGKMIYDQAGNLLYSTLY